MKKILLILFILMILLFLFPQNNNINNEKINTDLCRYPISNSSPVNITMTINGNINLNNYFIEVLIYSKQINYYNYSYNAENTISVGSIINIGSFSTYSFSFGLFSKYSSPTEMNFIPYNNYYYYVYVADYNSTNTPSLNGIGNDNPAIPNYSFQFQNQYGSFRFINDTSYAFTTTINTISQTSLYYQNFYASNNFNLTITGNGYNYSFNNVKNVNVSLPNGLYTYTVKSNNLTYSSNFYVNDNHNDINVNIVSNIYNSVFIPFIGSIIALFISIIAILYFDRNSNQFALVIIDATIFTLIYYILNLPFFNLALISFIVVVFMATISYKIFLSDY